MMTIEQDDDLLRRYLLGELPDGEAEVVEERLLHEEELFELAEAVEGDLLAACARGELSPAERKRIEQRLAATPRGRANLALAGDLTTVSREFTASSRKEARILPFPERVLRSVRRYARPYAMAASLVGALVLGGVAWQATHSPQGVRHVLAKLPLPEQTRGSSSAEAGLKVSRPRNAVVDLRLPLEGEPYKKFTVVISHDQGEVLRKDIDLEQEKEPQIRLGSDQVPAGYYTVKAIPQENPDDFLIWDLEVQVTG